MPKINIEKAWNTIADDYQKKYKISPTEIHYGVSIPSEPELNLLGNVKGKKALEVGCGGGQCSIAFAQKGAIVTGIDISEKQIEFAKKLADKMKVKANFLVSNAEKLDKIKSNSIDIVFSAYALQYVKNLRRAFQEFHRALKHNGVFVFSFDHPIYSIIDAKTLKIRRSYFNEGHEDWKWKIKNKNMKFRDFRRTIQTIFNDLAETGFAVEKILEPAPFEYEKEWSDFYPLKKIKMVPSAIIFKCRKK